MSDLQTLSERWGSAILVANFGMNVSGKLFYLKSVLVFQFPSNCILHSETPSALVNDSTTPVSHVVLIHSFFHVIGALQSVSDAVCW